MERASLRQGRERRKEGGQERGEITFISYSHSRGLLLLLPLILAGRFLVQDFLAFAQGGEGA